MGISIIGDGEIPNIKIIGVGGAGGNAINYMIDAKLPGVEFFAVNTDSQGIDHSKAETKIQIGFKITDGLGAGANPRIGRDAAIECIQEIKTALGGSNMALIIAGLGGGTGTGAAPVVAEICKEMGILTVAVVSKPFAFEGKKRMAQADMGLQALRLLTDIVIVIPNDRLRSFTPKNATILEMFKMVDETIYHTVKGITDLIMLPCLVNIGFDDLKSNMNKGQIVSMGIGSATGKNRAKEAVEKAICHPLIEDILISGARGVLINIISGSDLELEEMTEATELIYKKVGEDAEIIWWQSIDENIGDEMRFIVAVVPNQLDRS